MFSLPVAAASSPRLLAVTRISSISSFLAFSSRARLMPHLCACPSANRKCGRERFAKARLGACISTKNRSPRSIACPYRKHQTSLHRKRSHSLLVPIFLIFLNFFQNFSLDGVRIFDAVCGEPVIRSKDYSEQGPKLTLQTASKTGNTGFKYVAPM